MAADVPHILWVGYLVCGLKRAGNVRPQRDDRIPDTLAFKIVGGTTGTTGSQINAKNWDDGGTTAGRQWDDGGTTVGRRDDEIPDTLQIVGQRGDKG